MASLFKRIASRSATSTQDVTRKGHERIDCDELVTQVAAALTTLEDTQEELSRREQAMLGEAAGLYERMSAIAQELNDIRQQQSVASAQIAKLRGATQALEAQRSGASNLDHSESTRPEALVAQS